MRCPRVSLSFLQKSALSHVPKQRNHALAGPATGAAPACPLFSGHLYAARGTAAGGPLAPDPHVEPALSVRRRLTGSGPGPAIPRRATRPGGGPAHVDPGDGLPSTCPLELFRNKE